MKTVYYVRHGESQANVDKLAAGAEFDSPLTKNGRDQAKHAGRDLKDKNIELVVCSPMARTKETAKIIAETIGYPTYKIVENPLFTERKLGIYSKGPNTKYLEDAKKDVLHKSVETTEEMHKRVSKGFEWLRQLKPKNIVLVSHGGTGRIIRIIIQSRHHSEAYKTDGFGNTEIYQFTLE